MPHRYANGLLIAGIAGLLAAGCADEPWHSRFVKSASEPSTPPILEFRRQTLTFEPTRDDITVGRVVFSVYCSNPRAVRVNGVRPTSEWRLIDLEQVGRNRFEMAPLRIESLAPRSGLLCVSVKAWFNEVTNQYDALIYENLADRYALVSYCTSSAEHPPEVKARFSQNPVPTVSEFKEALAEPFVIELTQRPLRDEWRH